MYKKFIRPVLFASGVALFLAGCQSTSTMRGLQIVQITSLQPLDLPPGGTAVFRVEGLEFDGFQWKRDGVAIRGETQSVLIISNLQRADVAMYSVELQTKHTRVESQPVPLMMTLTSMGEGGNFGQKTVPFGKFPTGSDSCLPGMYKRFNAYYFDGPNRLDSTSAYPNPDGNCKDSDNVLIPGGCHTLVIDTIDPWNDSVDTGIVVKHSDDLTKPPWCNDNAASPPAYNVKLSELVVTLESKQRYRAGIFFKNNSAKKSVVFNWRYLE